jgi:hypothetical protein
MFFVCFGIDMQFCLVYDVFVAQYVQSCWFLSLRLLPLKRHRQQQAFYKSTRQRKMPKDFF